MRKLNNRRDRAGKPLRRQSWLERFLLVGKIDLAMDSMLFLTILPMTVNFMLTWYGARFPLSQAFYMVVALCLLGFVSIFLASRQSKFLVGLRDAAIAAGEALRLELEQVRAELLALVAERDGLQRQLGQMQGRHVGYLRRVAHSFNCFAEAMGGFYRDSARLQQRVVHELLQAAQNATGIDHAAIRLQRAELEGTTRLVTEEICKTAVEVFSNFEGVSNPGSQALFSASLLLMNNKGGFTVCGRFTQSGAGEWHDCLAHADAAFNLKQVQVQRYEVLQSMVERQRRHRIIADMSAHLDGSASLRSLHHELGIDGVPCKSMMVGVITGAKIADADILLSAARQEYVAGWLLISSSEKDVFTDELYTTRVIRELSHYSSGILSTLRMIDELLPQLDALPSRTVPVRQK